MSGQYTISRDALRRPHHAALRSAGAPFRAARRPDARVPVAASTRRERAGARLDARGRHAGAPRRDRQRRRPLRRHRARCAVPDARLAPRHRARRRQVRRHARRHQRHRVRRSAECAQASACPSRSRSSASATRKACASAPRCSAAAPSPARSIRRCSKPSTRNGITMRDALRELRLRSGARSRRSRARTATCSPTSSCTSSRARCSKPRACRSASSRAINGVVALRRRRAAAWPATRARCRWTCGAMRWRRPPSACSRSSASRSARRRRSSAPSAASRRRPARSTSSPARCVHARRPRAARRAARRRRSPTHPRGRARSPSAATSCDRVETLQELGVAACAPALIERSWSAPSPAEGLPVARLPSGAGHDGMAIGAIAADRHAVRALQGRHQPQPGGIDQRRGRGHRGESAFPLHREIQCSYPRDLVGYGAQPAARRTGRAARAIAVQFVLNYEEGGENTVLHGDAGVGDVPLRDRRRRSRSRARAT